MSYDEYTTFEAQKIVTSPVLVIRSHEHVAHCRDIRKEDPCALMCCYTSVRTFLCLGCYVQWNI